MMKIFILQYSDCDNAYAVEAHLKEENAIARWKECMESIGLSSSHPFDGPYNMGHDQQSTDDGQTYWLEEINLMEE